MLQNNYFSSPVSARGFTLIEIMVVVVIIAAMAAFLVSNLSSDADRIARLESEQFIVVINEVRDEAVLSGQAYILSLDESTQQYSFEPLNLPTNSQDDANSSDELLNTRTINQQIRVTWDVFEHIDDELEPAVFISSLGEITPFNARFGGQDNDYYVFVDDENQLVREVRDARVF